MKTITSEFFCGNRVSDYGLQNGFVDYATLAKAFDAVLNNNIIQATSNIGYWEGTNDYYYMDNEGNTYDTEAKEERIEALQDERDRLNDELESIEDSEQIEKIESRIQEIEDDLDTLDEEQYVEDIYQYYIVSDSGAELLKECGEIVYYNEELDMNVWGVTHYGTSWSYVLTNIKIEKRD